MVHSVGTWTPSGFGGTYSSFFKSDNSNSMMVHEQLNEIYAFIRYASNGKVYDMLNMLHFEESILSYKIYPFSGFNPRLFDGLCHCIRFYLDHKGRQVMFVPGIHSAVWVNSPEKHHVFIMNINYNNAIPIYFINKKLSIEYNHKFEEIQLLKFYVFENYNQLLKEFQNG